MDKKKILIGAVVVVGGYLLYRHFSTKDGKSSFSNIGGGQMTCECYDDRGNYSGRNTCRKSKHTDCESCCGHYGKTAVHEGEH